MGLFRKMVSWLKSHILFSVIFIAILTLIIHICISLFFNTGITLALPQYRLGNTQWTCVVEDDNGELMTLNLEFNKSGTILASRERGYELVKNGLKWKKFDYATVSGNNIVVSGKVYELILDGEVLTITEKTEFAGSIVQEWTCTRKNR